MSISLSFGLRNAVNSLTDINSAIQIANTRLATGKKVNSALDDASAFFTAQGFQREAQGLSGLQNNFDNGLKTIDKATKAIEGATKLLQSAQGLARQARALGATDATRDTYGTQIADLITQASRIFVDAGYNGKNLLVANATAPVPATDNIVIATNLSTGTSQTSVTLTATDFRFNAAPSATSLYGATATNRFDTANSGVNTAVSGGPGQAEITSYTATNFTVAGGDAKLDTLINTLGIVTGNLAARGQVIATAASVLQIRSDFTKSTQRILNSAADNLTLADVNEEGTNLTALQTRQQLSVTALSLAGRSDQAILRLF
jgi:flagellin